ncbi:MAG: hypothetical protein IAA97_03310 [Spirochaetes bacterium]|uniref:Type IX secretion system membrane protein PorP/SprF n=1 Tax=Candidatus Ornithospirochaeta stercoripullorum TaxID=2840899 RepID=A0A9D9E035_9SPIO|nr:hypothetical protein [Candidatus Ornithospirochaeta stercoripullorum]
MKRRLIVLCIAGCLAIASLSANVTPVKNFVDYGVFASPARLVDVDYISPFEIEAEAISSIEAIEFFASPVSSFGESAKALASYLSSQGIEFWNEHQGYIKRLEEIDPSFPERGENDELFEAKLQDYFKTRFLSSSYGDNNRAIATLAAIEDGIVADDLKAINGEMDLALKIHGGAVSSGQGWNAGLDLVFTGPESLFSSSITSGLLGVLHSEHGMVGYIVPDKLSAGFSVSPYFFFALPMSGIDLASARFSAQVLDLVLSNNIYAGIGMGFNFGIMYKPVENLSLALDFRNLPSAGIAFEFPLSELSSGFDIRLADSFMLVPPDVALSIAWDAGAWHLAVEARDVVSQMIANAMLNTDGLSWWDIFKGSVAYDFSESLSLALSYEEAMIGLEVRAGGFNAAILTRCDEFAIGLRCGYRV